MFFFNYSNNFSRHCLYGHWRARLHMFCSNLFCIFLSFVFLFLDYNYCSKNFIFLTLLFQFTRKQFQFEKKKKCKSNLMLKLLNIGLPQKENADLLQVGGKWIVGLMFLRSTSNCSCIYILHVSYFFECEWTYRYMEMEAWIPPSSRS